MEAEWLGTATGGVRRVAPSPRPLRVHTLISRRLPTQILGLTWTLILRYEIQRYGIDDPELLRWVRAAVKDRGLPVEDWGFSFNDGKVFAALMAKFAPEELSYEDCCNDPPIELLKKAFAVAEDVFDVPQLLDPADMAEPGASDDKSVILYVAKLRQVVPPPAEPSSADPLPGRNPPPRLPFLAHPWPTPRSLACLHCCGPRVVPGCHGQEC